MKWVLKRGWRKWGGNIQNRKGNDNNLSWGHKPPFHGYIKSLRITK